jgi:hypothetical protein
LRDWVKKFADDPEHAFPGHGQMKPEQLEIARLKREVTKLKGRARHPKKRSWIVFLLRAYGMSGKWLELVKQIMPDMTRAAVGEIERNIAEFARGTLTLRARWQVN